MLRLLILLHLPFIWSHYYLKTIIGTASTTGGSNGDGGPVTSAVVETPTGLWSDTIGNLYICDDFAGRIRKVDINGIITTIIGNGENSISGDSGIALDTSISGANSIYGDSNGNYLYFSDGVYLALYNQHNHSYKIRWSSSCYRIRRS